MYVPKVGYACAGPVQVLPLTVPGQVARSIAVVDRGQVNGALLTPGSLKVALAVTLLPSVEGSGNTVGVPTAGGMLLTVTMAEAIIR